LGENGAGKTTLVRVLYGSVRPDAGAIEIDGQAREIENPRRRSRSSAWYQHSMLDSRPPSPRTALGELPARLRGARFTCRREVLERFGVALDPGARRLVAGRAVQRLKRARWRGASCSRSTAHRRPRSARGRRLPRCSRGCATRWAWC
jgi:ABC-type thiamine transport system ATPase subunit